MISQVGIFIFGALAVYLVGERSVERRKYGYICGLLGQPFWYYTTYTTDQWGIFALSIFYTYSWGRGYVNTLKESD